MCYCSRSTSMSSKRSRSKTRKPKFISLRRQLSHPPPLSSMTPPPPLTIDHDRDPPVTSLLEPGDGPSLTSLLGASSTVASEAASTPSSSSMNWDGEIAIARKALRGRERWVFCCSASPSPPEQEASSSSHVVDLWCCAPQGLSLKLDYEEILTAWSDKGSLYIEGDSGHQVVPDVYHHTLSCDGGVAPSTTVFVDVGRAGNAVGGVWRVPEVGDEKLQGMAAAVAEEGESRREGKVGSREERVRRYKEKRQNRLFSKRIRYEVRKLNAEKRPRMKGRFVRREE